MVDRGDDVEVGDDEGGDDGVTCAQVASFVARAAIAAVEGTRCREDVAGRLVEAVGDDGSGVVRVTMANGQGFEVAVREVRD